MVTNMAFKSQQAETAQNNAAAASSRLLLEGSNGKKGIWGTEVRARDTNPSARNPRTAGVTEALRARTSSHDFGQNPATELCCSKICKSGMGIQGSRAFPVRHLCCCANSVCLRIE